MPAENIAFIDAVIGEKPIGRFRVRPVLSSKRNTLSHAVADLPQKLTKSLAKASIFESRLVDLARRPVIGWNRAGALVEAT